MAEFTCSNCGQRVQGDECPHCRVATAIATPEHAEQVKVRLAGSRESAICEGEPPLPKPVPPIRNAGPSFLERLSPIAIALGVLFLFLIAAFVLGVWAGLRAAHF